MDARSARKFLRVQLSTGPLVAIVLLAGLSLITSFYLGLLTGKSLRIPESHLATKHSSLSPQSESIQNESQLGFLDLPIPSEEAKEVVFEFASTEATERLKQIERKTQKLQKQNLIANTQTKFEDLFEEKVEKTKMSEQKSSTKLATASLPEKKLYTVQVSSSRSKAISEQLATRLQRQGFSSYLQSYISPAGTTFYRVRVGRNEKEVATAQAEKLKQLNFIDSVQVTRM